MLAILATVPLFTECEQRDLRRIDSAGTFVDVEAGRVLCREGQVGDECFVVLSGYAEVTIDDRPVCTVDRGALIGEIALLSSSGRRVATVIAQTPMSLFVVGRREFGDFVRTTPGLAGRLVYEVSERLTDALARARNRESDEPRHDPIALNGATRPERSDGSASERHDRILARVENPWDTRELAAMFALSRRWGRWERRHPGERS